MQPLCDVTNGFLTAFDQYYQFELERAKSVTPLRRDHHDLDASAVVFGDESDDFGQRVETAFAGIQAFFSPHLR